MKMKLSICIASMLLAQKSVTAFQPARMMQVSAKSIFMQPRQPARTTTLAMSSDAPATVQRMVRVQRT